MLPYLRWLFDLFFFFFLDQTTRVSNKPPKKNKGERKWDTTKHWTNIIRCAQNNDINPLSAINWSQIGENLNDLVWREA